MAETLEVRTTRRTDGVRLAASSTWRVPRVAGSMSWRTGSSTPRTTTGEAVWKTRAHPAMARSNPPRSIRSARKSDSVPGSSPAIASRCSVFRGSAGSRTVARTSKPRSRSRLTTHDAT